MVEDGEYLIILATWEH